MEDLLYLVASSDRPTVIALTETWLDSSIPSYEVELPSYRLYRRDRSRHGGGVVMYVHESANVRSSLSHPISELLSAGTDFDLSQLDETLLSRQLSNITHAIVVMDLLSVCSEYGLVQCVTESTRVASSCESLLDLVLGTESSILRDLSVGCPLGSSGHYSLSVVFLSRESEV